MSRKLISLGCLSAFAAVLVLVTGIVTKDFFLGFDRFNPAGTVEMIERHLQEGRTNLPADRVSSVARTLYEEARFYGIDYRLALAIMAVESNFRNDAVSSAGAHGIMQIMPILAASVAGKAGIPYREATDLFDPENNVRFALYYLSWLSTNFKNLNEILLAYNVGHNRARRLLSKTGDADTRYTRRVIGEYQRNMMNLPEI